MFARCLQLLGELRIAISCPTCYGASISWNHAVKIVHASWKAEFVAKFDAASQDSMYLLVLLKFKRGRQDLTESNNHTNYVSSGQFHVRGNYLRKLAMDELKNFISRLQK